MTVMLESYLGSKVSRTLYLHSIPAGRSKDSCEEWERMGGSQTQLSQNL